MELIDHIEVQNELGEGIIWDPGRGCLWWTDIQGRKLFRYCPQGRQLESWNTPERLACLAPVEDRNHLVAAFESGFAWYDPEQDQLEWIHKIEPDNPGTRMNDGRTDRQGRFWAGSMIEDPASATEGGSLYCLGHDLSLRQYPMNLKITNSLCWSPDSQIMYHCDTPTRIIDYYQFDSDSGEPGQRFQLCKTDRGCYPDGSSVDAQGYLWNAQWGGSKVVRYSAEGQVHSEVEVPVSQPSCVTFAGQDLDLLAVTSAWQDLDDAQRQQQPYAGDVFIFKSTFRGIEDSPFKPASGCRPAWRRT